MVNILRVPTVSNNYMHILLLHVLSTYSVKYKHLRGV